MVVVCPKCFIECARKRDLERHLDRLVPCDAGQHQCEGCCLYYKTKKSLHDHKKRCKGKSQALIAHEAALKLQPQELIFGESEVSQSDKQKDEVGQTVLDSAASSGSTLQPSGSIHIINHPGFIEFGTRKILKTHESPQQICVYDFIAAITNLKSNSAASKAFLRLQEKPTTTMFKFSGRCKCTPVADIPACKKIAIQVLAGARMSLKQKNSILKALGMAEAILLRAYIEEETLEPVIKVFSSLRPVKQFSCGPFLIDLYFPNQRIALECDEWGHAHYNADDELERQKFIEGQLNCTFVRYNPNAQNFRVVDLIAELMPMLMTAKSIC